MSNLVIQRLNAGQLVKNDAMCRCKKVGDNTLSGRG